MKHVKTQLIDNPVNPSSKTDSVRGSGKKLTPLRAAHKMMKHVGYCVVGLNAKHAKDTHFKKGRYFLDFGGHSLGGEHAVVIVSTSKRSEWDEQFRFLFPKLVGFEHEMGMRYFRCVLEKRDSLDPDLDIDMIRMRESIAAVRSTEPPQVSTSSTQGGTKHA